LPQEDGGVSERHDEDAGKDPRSTDGFIARVRAAQLVDVARMVAWAAVGLVWLVVVLDLAGVLDVFGDEQIEPSAGSRVPGEYLYLDDERVDAYLGQLRGGLSPTEQRSISLTERREAQAGLDQVVQIGGTFERQERIDRTVESNAADRFFLLESELEARFTQVDDVGLRFKSILAPGDACKEISRLEEIKEGQILRILGANLRVPTYALALAKIAHADQFRPDDQEEVSPQRLAQLAREGQRGLKQLVKSLGTDPQLPFRLQIKKGGCQVFMPARYSKVFDAPSMLTGPITIVGKVVRRLTRREDAYFDVDTAIRWERALRQSAPRVRRLLGLDEVGVRKVVNSSATVDYPGLVLLPLAMYK
jgi:hypothetical protein